MIVIAAHSIVALVAVLLGVFIFVNRKGTALHRQAGWYWVGLLSVVSVTGLFIKHINPGEYSPIHILIPITLGSMAFAIYAIRRFRDTRRDSWKYAHAIAMSSVFVGGLMIAGALTLLPGRVIHGLLFG